MLEPNPILRFAIYHFGGGDAFLTGLIVFIASESVLIWRCPGHWKTLGRILSRFGMIWAATAPSPVSPWLIGVLGTGLVLRWCNRQRRPSQELLPAGRSVMPLDQILSGIVIGSALAIILLELPYRFMPAIGGDATNRLGIVADSVSAGLNDGEDTWPKRLARSTSLQIIDASQPGATLCSALRQLKALDSSPSLLLLEIGGNDLLEGLPVAQFEHDLNELLLAAREPGRTLVMFELPLPPLAMRYGAIQRRLARQYEASLIPRRCLLKVLTSSGGTVDGIHLSPQGHQLMADLLQNLLNFEGVAPFAQGHYMHLESN